MYSSHYTTDVVWRSTTLEASTLAITLPTSPRTNTLEASTLTITPPTSPRTNTLEASTQTITQPMWCHDLPHSKRIHKQLHHRPHSRGVLYDYTTDMVSRSTTPEVSTLFITPAMCSHASTTLAVITLTITPPMWSHDLPHSRRVR